MLYRHFYGQLLAQAGVSGGWVEIEYFLLVFHQQVAWQPLTAFLEKIVWHLLAKYVKRTSLIYDFPTMSNCYWERSRSLLKIVGPILETRLKRLSEGRH